LKKLKKVAFVDTGQFSRLLGEDFSIKESTFWDGGFLLTSFASGGAFAHKLTRTRLSIDRLSGGPREGLLFESTEWLFAPGCGWAILVDLEPSLLSTFTAALHLLGMEGIGSDRTSGVGQFDLLAEPQPWPEPALGSGAFMLLSLCWPSQEDIAKGILDGCYAFAERSGWITAAGARSLRRGRLRMLTEGSWYPVGASVSPGSVARVQDPNPDLGLNHSVFRDGRGLTISIRREEIDG
jgi:CRISPR type III-A-associated RAMP protein Csm4